MELRHLRYFIAAAEEEHFGRASERLHVTRPAVSQIVADLEAELGTALFERQAHRVRLTPAGQALLPQLRDVMDGLGQALAVAKRVGEGKSGVLNIGYGSLTLMHPLFREALRRFEASCPDATLSLHEMQTRDQVRALARGTIDAGFMHFGPFAPTPRRKRGATQEAPDDAALELLRIQSSSLGAAFPASHPLARRKSVRLSELAEERFVVVPRSAVSPGYGPLFALCQKAGFEPWIVHEVSTVGALYGLVSNGMGVALTMFNPDIDYPDRLKVVPVKDVDYATQFVLGWVKGRHDPVLERMAEIVRELTAPAGSANG